MWTKTYGNVHVEGMFYSHQDDNRRAKVRSNSICVGPFTLYLNVLFSMVVPSIRYLSKFEFSQMKSKKTRIKKLIEIFFEH